MSVEPKPRIEAQPLNGSMASNMEEVIKLGKQMEKLRSSGELKLHNRVSDPAQYEEEV
ncbi:multidrug ABC transporter ATPase [Rossellomorea sp. YZS02]|uniref:multidrug ABC transporter ATPase n=1 Tax=Rossellomorea sp. YZS02 TaxID=3097358 RepID=UPI002A0DDCAF|nr:multidrug ABC transporter ATPase [Rossellomorea sp. YZS02]MDX8343291.1 multidrug ABC transporter ATPase [Rossellomorea sp. YZS02]